MSQLIDNIVMEIDNFILFNWSDEEDRAKIRKQLEVYKKEDLEERYGAEE